MLIAARSAAFFTAGVALLALAALPAAGIVYVMPTDESMVDRSPVIVFGEVLSVQPGTDPDSPTTDYLFRVEEVLKGFVAGSGIMVRQPGGVTADGQAMRIMGLPMLAEGNRVLLFLRPEEKGAHSIVEYGLGMFFEARVGGRVFLLREPALRGEEFLRGDSSAATASRGYRDAPGFRRWIADRGAGVRRASDYFAEAPESATAVASPFRLIAECDGRRVRWRVFDEGGSVVFGVHWKGQPGLVQGGRPLVARALRVWNADPASNVSLEWDDIFVEPRLEDRSHSITFEDPHDEIEGSYRPDVPTVLAVTKIWWNCKSIRSPRGFRFSEITGVSMTTQDGFQRYLEDFDSRTAERAFQIVMTHELGHALGIGHPCEKVERSTCHDDHPNHDAIMWYEVDPDRDLGTALHSDDRAAVRHLYPDPNYTRAPDLVVESPRSTESSVTPGGAFTFAATVRNRGDERSSTTTLTYYRSSNSTITPADTTVGTDTVRILFAFATDRHSIGQRAPSRPGTYYYGACVSPVSGESDTANNCSSGVRVTVTGGESGPDLVVESPRSTERSVAPRGAFRFGATVRNRGDERSSATTLTYYRSSDSRITMSDTRVGTDPIGALSVSATERESIGQRAPSRPGTYYYGACVNPVSGESNRANNCSSGVRVTVTGGESGPDLVVESPRSTERSVAPRGAFRFGATVRNRGDERSSATTLTYYRSSDSRITTSDTRVGTDAIGALSVSATERESIGQRAPSRPGTYYYGACVNPVSGESNRGNNCSTGVGVTVTGGGGSSGPDLVVESPRSTERSVAPRGAFRFGATVRNRGDERSSATTLTYYRSSDSRITMSDTRVGTDAIGALSASATERESIGQRAPSRSGTYYYGACVSPVSGESNRANNCSTGVRVTVTGGDDVIGGGFDLVSDNARPQGIAYAQGRFYVVGESREPGNEKVYAYRASDGHRDPAADFNLARDNARPTGITYAQGRFYVVDEDDEKVYAYRASDGRRDAAADFNLVSETTQPQGITYAADRFYVVDWTGLEVHAYGGSDGRHDPAAGFSLAWTQGVTVTLGITYAHGRFYVQGGGLGNSVLAYRASDGRRDAAADFNLSADNGVPTGITYVQGRFYVLDWTDLKVYAYRASGG